jgi:hypothetical protein
MTPHNRPRSSRLAEEGQNTDEAPLHTLSLRKRSRPIRAFSASRTMADVRGERLLKVPRAAYSRPCSSNASGLHGRNSARIGKSARAFKGIICDDVSEFESYMPSHAVGLCRVRSCQPSPSVCSFTCQPRSPAAERQFHPGLPSTGSSSS